MSVIYRTTLFLFQSRAKWPRDAIRQFIAKFQGRIMNKLYIKIKGNKERGFFVCFSFSLKAALIRSLFSWQHIYSQWRQLHSHQITIVISLRRSMVISKNAVIAFHGCPLYPATQSNCTIHDFKGYPAMTKQDQSTDITGCFLWKWPTFEWVVQQWMV